MFDYLAFISPQVEVVVQKSGKGKKGGKGKIKSSESTSLVPIPSGPTSMNVGEKKVCLWPMGNGTTCGKTFTKFDSLKRHLAEAHKGEEECRGNVSKSHPDILKWSTF